MAFLFKEDVFMKFTKNILIVLGLLLQVGISFTASSDEKQAILDRIRKEKSNPKSIDWEHTGPTREDILAATKVENLAAKESREDKLISAVKNGDLKNVEALIAAGVGLEARDNENMTALMIVAKKGYTDIASRLINAGAHVDATDWYNRTALSRAVDGGHAEIVKLLITNGAAKSQKNFGELFVSVVFNGNNEMVKAFLVEGSRIDQDTLETANMFARHRCSTEVVNAIKELQTKTNS